MALTRSVSLSLSAAGSHFCEHAVPTNDEKQVTVTTTADRVKLWRAAIHARYFVAAQANFPSVQVTWEDYTRVKGRLIRSDAPNDQSVIRQTTVRVFNHFTTSWADASGAVKIITFQIYNPEKTQPNLLVQGHGTGTWARCEFECLRAAVDGMDSTHREYDAIIGERGHLILTLPDVHGNPVSADNTVISQPGSLLLSTSQDLDHSPSPVVTLASSPARPRKSAAVSIETPRMHHSTPRLATRSVCIPPPDNGEGKTTSTLHSCDVSTSGLSLPIGTEVNTATPTPPTPGTPESSLSPDAPSPSSPPTSPDRSVVSNPPRLTALAGNKVTPSPLLALATVPFAYIGALRKELSVATTANSHLNAQVESLQSTVSDLEETVRVLSDALDALTDTVRNNATKHNNTIKAHDEHNKRQFEDIYESCQLTAGKVEKLQGAKASHSDSLSNLSKRVLALETAASSSANSKQAPACLQDAQAQYVCSTAPTPGLYPSLDAPHCPSDPALPSQPPMVSETTKRGAVADDKRLGGDEISKPPSTRDRRCPPSRAPLDIDGAVNLIIGDSNLRRVRPYRLDRTGETRTRTLPGVTITELSDLLADEYHPQLKKVIVHVGTNDVRIRSVSAILSHFKGLIQQVRRSFPSARIALTPTLPQVGGPNHVIDRVNMELDRLCLNTDVTLLRDSNLSPHHFVRDGVHLTQKGVAVFVREMLQFLKPGPIKQKEGEQRISTIVGIKGPQSASQHDHAPTPREAYRETVPDSDRRLVTHGPAGPSFMNNPSQPSSPPTQQNAAEPSLSPRHNEQHMSTYQASGQWSSPSYHTHMYPTPTHYHAPNHSQVPPQPQLIPPQMGACYPSARTLEPPIQQTALQAQLCPPYPWNPYHGSSGFYYPTPVPVY